VRALRTRRARAADDAAVEFEPHDLAGLFRTPTWLRDLGLTAWFAVGVTLLVVGTIWILSLTHTIVSPVIAATVMAAVASPAVSMLQRRGLARGFGAALVLIVIVVLSAVVVVIVVGGITGQSDSISEHLSSARDTLARWLTDLGVDRKTAQAAKDDASSTVSQAVPALLNGVAGGLQRLSSLAVFLSLTALSLFFLLKDGGEIRRWAESRIGVPEPMAHRMGQRVLESLRGYFLGVTLVAAFNAVLVGIGALLLGVPLAGTIAVITFVGAYIPYLGAWGAGAFSVLLALGGAGTDAAIGMIVIQLLANGILQQMVQPIAYGAALGIHPLAVLIVTVAGGALFGAVGLILAAPLTSAATRIAADLSRDRAAAEEAASGAVPRPSPTAGSVPP
jgi:predicted PurR-regulated permease PerM